jgi:hypothetical protein
MTHMIYMPRWDLVCRASTPRVRLPSGEFLIKAGGLVPSTELTTKRSGPTMQIPSLMPAALHHPVSLSVSLVRFETVPRDFSRPRRVRLIKRRPGGNATGHEFENSTAIQHRLLRVMVASTPTNVTISNQPLSESPSRFSSTVQQVLMRQGDCRRMRGVVSACVCTVWASNVNR